MTDHNDDDVVPKIDIPASAAATLLARTLLTLTVSSGLSSQLRLQVYAETLAVLLVLYAEGTDEELAEQTKAHLLTVLPKQREQVEGLLAEAGAVLKRKPTAEVQPPRKETIH